MPIGIAEQNVTGALIDQPTDEGIRRAVLTRLTDKNLPNDVVSKHATTSHRKTFVVSLPSDAKTQQFNNQPNDDE